MQEPSGLVHVRVWLAEDLFPCCAVHVAWYWIEMGVGVHGEPGAYIVVTLMSLIREDFIDGASWMLLECWGQMPELARLDGTVWGCLCRVL